MATRESMNNVSVFSILTSFITTSAILLVQLQNFSLPLLINQADNQKHQLLSMIVDYNITKKDDFKKVWVYENKLLDNILLHSFEGSVEFPALN